ncbi:hypothetical protein ABFX02_09G111000 [Erythranthe guttata]
MCNYFSLLSTFFLILFRQFLSTEFSILSLSPFHLLSLSSSPPPPLILRLNPKALHIPLRASIFHSRRLAVLNFPGRR